MPTRHEVVLPDLGVDEGPIVVGLWLLEPGSPVAEGDPIAELLAGAAVIDLPAPADGVLVERLVDEDEPLEVGQVLALIESDEES
jgi:2-oxoglutarate dehydrogenase E2 component (dihydrolipoamide succinyltransferase)